MGWKKEKTRIDRTEIQTGYGDAPVSKKEKKSSGTKRGEKFSKKNCGSKKDNPT